MSLFLPNQAIHDSFGDTMAKLGMITQEEAQRFNQEDGLLAESTGAQPTLSEGKGKHECPAKMKDMMKHYMKDMDGDQKAKFMSHMKGYMKDHPGCSAEQMKAHMADYMKKHMKEDEDEGTLDGDSFFEDDENKGADAELDSFFEDEDKDGKKDDDDDDDDCDESAEVDLDAELSEEERALLDEEDERFEEALKVIESFENLSEDEVEQLTVGNLITIMSAQQEILDTYEDIFAEELNDEGELVQEITVRKRATAAGRRQARKMQRGGGRSKARMARAKTARRTAHMSPMQKVRYLAKKGGKSVRDVMIGRAQARSRSKGGKSVQVARRANKDFAENVEAPEQSIDLFKVMGSIRAMSNQPVESVNHDELSRQIHAAYDVVENMATAVAERMQKDIDENASETEKDPRADAVSLFRNIAQGAATHHEEMQGGKYTVERAIDNLDTLVSDLVRGKEQCKAIN